MANHADTAEAIKALGDTLSLGVMLGAITSFLPAVAALFTILWTGIRIYEWFRVRVLKRTALTEEAPLLPNLGPATKD